MLIKEMLRTLRDLGLSEEDLEVPLQVNVDTKDKVHGRMWCRYAEGAPRPLQQQIAQIDQGDVCPCLSYDIMYMSDEWGDMGRILYFSAELPQEVEIINPTDLGECLKATNRALALATNQGLLGKKASHHEALGQLVQRALRTKKETIKRLQDPEVRAELLMDADLDPGATLDTVVGINLVEAIERDVGSVNLGLLVGGVCDPERLLHDTNDQYHLCLVPGVILDNLVDTYRGGSRVYHADSAPLSDEYTTEVLETATRLWEPYGEGTLKELKDALVAATLV